MWDRTRSQLRTSDVFLTDIWICSVHTTFVWNELISTGYRFENKSQSVLYFHVNFRKREGGIGKFANINDNYVLGCYNRILFVFCEHKKWKCFCFCHMMMMMMCYLSVFVMFISVNTSFRYLRIPKNPIHQNIKDRKIKKNKSFKYT